MKPKKADGIVGLDNSNSQKHNDDFLTANYQKLSSRPFFHDLFDEPISKDDNTSVSDMQNSFKKEYYNFLFNGSKINRAYHKSDIKMNNKIIMHIIYLCWASFFVVSAIIIISLIKGSLSIAIVSAISEAFINIIATIMIKVLRKSVRNTEMFFWQSADSEELSKVIGLINTFAANEKMPDLVEILVNNYCDKYTYGPRYICGNRNNRNGRSKDL